MTPEQLQAQINEVGELTRADIEEILEFYADPDNAYTNVQTFLTGVTCITDDQKISVLNDILSYA